MTITSLKLFETISNHPLILNEDLTVNSFPKTLFWKADHNCIGQNQNWLLEDLQNQEITQLEHNEVG